MREPPVGNYFDSDRAVARRDRREPERHGARLSARHAHEVLERRHRGRRLRPRAPFRRALREVPPARRPRPDGDDVVRASRRTRRSAHRLAKAYDVGLRRPELPGADLRARHGARRQPLRDGRGPRPVPVGALRRRAGAARPGPATRDARTDVDPQFAGPARRRGYGIGFRVGELEGHRTVGHGGAIYGFATSLARCRTRSSAPSRSRRWIPRTRSPAIAHEALRLMLAAREGARSPRPATEPVPPELARSLEGTWGAGGKPEVGLTEAGGELSMLSCSGGEPKRLRQVRDDLVTDGRLSWGRRSGSRRTRSASAIARSRRSRRENPRRRPRPGRS